MRLVADLHIHSRYSRATSPKLGPARIERWARIKGLGLVGTGDCTHPAWLAELRAALDPAEEGLFRLKADARLPFDRGEALAESLPEPAEGSEARFVLSGEISTIYSRGGRTRKVHHLVLLPGFAAAEAFQERLTRVGNVASDGRPILGLDSRDLYALLLEADERSILVPAHIWTPWFSALGARSGFDSIDECYGDLAPRIGAIETGLSSNPPMNWALSSLDRFAIVSNSDAHSPEKLGREATVLELEPGFAGLAEALAGGGPRGSILGTIEFFPQEGKYHYDGHRACGVVLPPEESAARGGLCPACGKALTPGVMGRVAVLADRPVDEAAPCPRPGEAPGPRANQKPYESLVPLDEVLAELLGAGTGSKKVAAAYNALVREAGSELRLLRELPEREIAALGCPGLPGELLARALGRMRGGLVSLEPGYDGEYGSVRTLAPGEDREAEGAAGLFGGEGAGLAPAKPEPRARSLPRRLRRPAPAGAPGTPLAPAPEGRPRLPEAPLALDPAQAAALAHPGGPALVIAGPGTGKTALLALRAARLLDAGLEPESILALTFTNKAAESLRERLGRAAGPERAARVAASTFHAFCRSLLAERAAEAGLDPAFAILGEEERDAILGRLAGKARGARRLGDYIETRKRFLLLPGEARPRLGAGAPAGLPELAEELGLPALEPELEPGYAAYRAELKATGCLDFEDLVAGAARLLAARPEALAALRARVRALFVDEYQDLNFAQYALMRLLAPSPEPEAGAAPELFVIGDPDQAIYGFRGSDRRFIERFRADYPSAKEYRLTRSFRCAAPIVGAAGSLVGSRIEGAPAPGSRGPAGEVALYRSEYPSGKSEAEGIAREIDRLVGGTGFFARDSGVAGAQEGELRSLGECAILVRAAALAPPLEKALADHGIPCRLVGEPSQEGYEPRTERVWIMTMHAAKGLEFDQVFVAGLEEGILPFTLYDEREEGGDFPAERVEEERRLLYVAMTRARIGLRLSWARSRSFRGRELELPPSRFLAGLAGLVPLVEAGPPRPRDPQLGLF